MRLWSLHPRYLDHKGLVALWREALLAKKVLEGKTKGYKHHPQLIRFNSKAIHFINSYLLNIWKEAEKRGYKFNKEKIGKELTDEKIEVTEGQLLHEIEHLKNKLKKRQPGKEFKHPEKILPNELFKIIPGLKEKWEKS